MTKYLLLFGLGWIVWWLWRKTKISAGDLQRHPVQREAERMVRCSYCGVNQPLSESILVGDQYYCCVKHRSEAESKGN